MLPGLKFLFATVVLSISVLIFGLGAAALLRSAHDEFVTMPAWRTAQQPMFAPATDVARIEMPRSEAARPTLSLARIDPVAPPLPDTKKADAPKLASIDPKTATDAKLDPAKQTAETDKPVVKKLRRSRNAAKRKRYARRTTIAQQPQSFTSNSDPFAGFGGGAPLANPPSRR